MMRVAYLCADPGVPIFGTKGASVHVQEIVRAFLARGDEVTIFCSRRGDRVPSDLATVPVVEMRIHAGTPSAREARTALIAERLAEAAIAERCDLVYERFSLFSDAAARIAASGAASIVEVNAPLIDEQRQHRVLIDDQAADAAARRVLGSAGVVACVSREVAAWAGAHGAADAIVSPNGVNTARIRPADTALGGPREAFTVGFVGTLKPWHGVETLIDAVAAMRDASTPTRLVVVGDGPEALALRERAGEHGLDVEFVGALAPEAIPAELARFDVGVAPYPGAGREHYFSPLKVYEYLAAGLPVVASRVGQIPDALTDGTTGLLVEPGSVTDLSRALAELRDAPECRRSMGGYARRAAVERHDWARVLARLLGALPTASAPHRKDAA